MILKSKHDFYIRIFLKNEFFVNYKLFIIKHKLSRGDRFKLLHFYLYMKLETGNKFMVKKECQEWQYYLLQLQKEDFQTMTKIVFVQAMQMQLLQHAEQEYLVFGLYLF